METCVLIPQELSLAITDSPRGVDKGQRETSVSVFSNCKIPKGTRILPFQGTIRIDKLDVFSYLDDNDVRHRFGLYDEITLTGRCRVRHCNWVRFVKVSPTFHASVNVLGARHRGEPVYEVIKPIPSDTELIVYFLPERPEDFLVPAFHFFRATLYRRTMGSILEESPLDLSMSLLSRGHGPGSSGSESSDEGRSVSGDSAVSSPSADLEGPLKNPVLSPQAIPTPLAVGPIINTPSIIRKPRERTMLPCEVCGKAFDRPSLLKRHMRTHTGEKPHVCDVCGKGFSTSSSLNTHRRIHSGEKPHQCQVCGKRFTASSNLYYHRMTHIKEKPHKCSLCSKSFPTPGDLKSHMYVHNGSWPYKCHICNRGFSKHTNLKNHLFLHTGDKPHACELCHKKFALACNLRAHMKTHEGDPQEECDQCGRSFLTASQHLVHGFCADCLPSDKGLALVKDRSTPQSVEVK